MVIAKFINFILKTLIEAINVIAGSRSRDPGIVRRMRRQVTVTAFAHALEGGITFMQLCSRDNIAWHVMIIRPMTLLVFLINIHEVHNIYGSVSMLGL